MGLDTVELVMRCEEVFAIDIPNEMAETVITVGSLYGVVCRRLDIVPLKNPANDAGFCRLHPDSLSLSHRPWNSEDIWATVVGIVVDQLQVRKEEVTFTARLQDDLGCD